MSSSSSTTPAKKVGSVTPVIGRFQSIITHVLLVVWAFLVTIGIATVIDPNWLDFISMKEKKDVAMTLESAGNEEFTRGNLREADRLFREALKVKPDLGNAMVGLGQVQLALGREEEAISFFRKGLENNPILPDFAYGNLGIIYEKRGDFVKALENYHKAAETAPEPTEAYSQLGQIYLKQQQPDSALVYFRAAMDNLMDMRVAYEAILIFTKRFKAEDSALVAFIDEKLEAGIPDEELSRFDIEIFIQSRTSTQRSVIVHHLLGVSLAILGRFDEGIPYIEKALQLAPDNSIIRNDLELARHEQRQAMVSGKP